MLVKQCFWQNLKLTDATPVYKKKYSNLVENYMPVSVLPSVSKMFDRTIEKQISCHIINLLSHFLSGYRKKASVLNRCVIIYWKEQNVPWQEKICRSCSHGLIKSCQIPNYMHTVSLARTKINFFFSSWSNLLQGVLQGQFLVHFCSIYTYFSAWIIISVILVMILHLNLWYKFEFCCARKVRRAI